MTRSADCVHEDEPIYSKGLCSRCYARAKYRRRMDAMTPEERDAFRAKQREYHRDYQREYRRKYRAVPENRARERERDRESKRRHYDANKDLYRKRNYMARFDITASEYDDLVARVDARVCES